MEEKEEVFEYTNTKVFDEVEVTGRDEGERFIEILQKKIIGAMGTRANSITWDI